MFFPWGRTPDLSLSQGFSPKERKKPKFFYQNCTFKELEGKELAKWKGAEGSERGRKGKQNRRRKRDDERS